MGYLILTLIGNKSGLSKVKVSLERKEMIEKENFLDNTQLD